MSIIGMISMRAFLASKYFMGGRIKMPRQ